MRYAGRTGNGVVFAEPGCRLLTVFVLEKYCELTFQNKKRLFDLMRVSGAALARRQDHDRQCKAARGQCVGVGLAGPADADQTVLAAPPALDLGIGKGIPVRFQLAISNDPSFGEFLDRYILKLVGNNVLNPVHSRIS